MLSFRPSDAIRARWLACARRLAVLPGLVLVGVVQAAETAVVAGPSVPPEIAGTGPSVVRLLGALALVMALVLGVFWFMRNGVRWMPKGSGSRKLKVLEGRVLGHRQSLVVVGYEGERLLLGTSPAGITFLTRLPSVEEPTEGTGVVEPMASFGEALQQVLSRRG